MEPIEIVEYDPSWPAQFAEIAGRVRAAFADGPPITVEHIGSTSVAGLAAKPIIDIGVVVPASSDAPDAIARLATLGYVHQANLGIAGHEAFRSPANGPRHRLCVYPRYISPLLRELLAFRDYLRTHPDEADQYAALKKELAARFSSDHVGYTEAKTDFVRSVLAKARGSKDG